MAISCYSRNLLKIVDLRTTNSNDGTDVPLCNQGIEHHRGVVDSQ